VHLVCTAFGHHIDYAAGDEAVLRRDKVRQNFEFSERVRQRRDRDLSILMHGVESAIQLERVEALWRTIDADVREVLVLKPSKPRIRSSLESPDASRQHGKRHRVPPVQG
jgi:hypothetical protein